MARPKNHDLEKKTLNLRKGDFEKLAALHPHPGPSVMLRKIISAYVDSKAGENRTSNLDIKL